MNKRDIKGERLTDSKEIAKNSKIHDIKAVQGVEKPKHNPSKMSRIIPFLKRTASLLAGIIGGGGSLIAGFDPSTAVLIAVSAAMLVLGVELAVVKEFKELFEDD